MIEQEPGILSAEWMLIGRQVRSDHGGIIDLIAIAPDGSLVVIELKRDRTPRDVLAQALDYATWVERLESADIARIYRNYTQGRSLDADFRERFGAPLEEEALGDSHQIVIVAAQLDAATERIVDYLADRGITINVILFQVFEHEGDLLLSRAWLFDPAETQVEAASSSRESREKEPWNGEFYVSFGPSEHRPWEDARRHGFVSAGGGVWYTQTLGLLNEGDRVWVKIPRSGFVGVGRVTQPVTDLADFTLSADGADRPAIEVLSNAEMLRRHADNPEKAERFVRVEWIQTVPESQAFDEVGLFGNQNTVCRPRTGKWRETVERLKQVFPHHA